MAGVTAKHGASGQSLGYFYQCMWAVVELGRRGADAPEVELRLELLDDVQFGPESNPTELLQTKHHIGGRAALTANSVDVWRSLNVWMDLPSDCTAILRLVTTAEADADGDLAALRAGSTRNVGAAHAALLVAAEATPGNKTSSRWRQRFLELDTAEQERLVNSIFLEDAAPHAADIDAELVKVFRWAIPPGQESAFVSYLKGWWAGICVRLLDRSLPAITGQDLLNHISDLIDQFRSDTLPIDPAVFVAFSEADSLAYSDRKFVRQLTWIALDNRRLWKAIRDYHRAYTQRSTWLRHNLVSESEIERYAFKLHDEWEYVFDARVAAMHREGRVDREIVGQEILESMALDAKARIRERFDERWFCRGTLHSMAEGELGGQLGWHPDFEALLEDMLSDVRV